MTAEAEAREYEREMPDAHAWHIPRLVTAWCAALLLAVLVTLLTPAGDRFAWLALAIGVSVLISFALQLGTAEKVGFITRLAFSVAGAAVIISVVDVVDVLLRL